MAVKPQDISEKGHLMPGVGRDADVAIYVYANGPEADSGDWYGSTSALPYHTVIIDWASLKGRADTPDGFMGRRTIAGVWHIGEARWGT